PRSPSPPLFPYTTLFRSRGLPIGQGRVGIDEPAHGALHLAEGRGGLHQSAELDGAGKIARGRDDDREDRGDLAEAGGEPGEPLGDRKSTRLNSSHQIISY